MKKAPIYILLVWVSLLLSACLDEGENMGNSDILLNASMLKGRIQAGVVRVYDSDGNWLWQGKTDDNGIALIPVNRPFQGEVIIQLYADSDTTMYCDATNCENDSNDDSYQFGDIIPAQSLEGLALSSVFSFDDGASSQEYTLQINALTQLSKVWLDHYFSTLDNQLNPAYLPLGLYSSKLINMALGLQLSSDINLFSLTVLDINKVNRFHGVSHSVILLSLINASFSYQLGLMDEFSSVLQQYSFDPNNFILQNKLELIQKSILLETMKLAALPIFDGIPNSVLLQLEKATMSPLDFTTIADALINDDNDLSLSSNILRVTSSSNQWSPVTDNARHKSWWWVSGTETYRNEWFQVDFATPINPQYLFLAIDEQFKGYNLRLQARNAGDHIWSELSVDLSSFIDDSGVTDEKNTISAIYPLITSDAYSSFRLISPPTSAIWLESFCFYDIQPLIEDACQFADKYLPLTITVSSLNFSPANILSDNGNSFWVSSMASGDTEWLEIEYNFAFMAKKFTLKSNVNYLGKSPKIEGLDSEGQWKTLKEIDSDALKAFSDVTGDFTATISLDSTGSYQRYRYYSEATSFVLLESLYFLE